MMIGVIELKRFNPNWEIKYGRKNTSNYMIPLLIICCSILAMIGYTFSTKLIVEENKQYTIRIDFNNNQDTYLKKVNKGHFKDTINLEGNIDNINCTEGKLNINETTGEITSDNVSSDIKCIYFIVSI